MFLPMSWNTSYADAAVTSLFDNAWIDDHTRAVVAEVYVYNFNHDVFIRTQYLFEVSAGGAWIPSQRQDKFQLFSLATVSFGYIVMVVLFVIVLLINIAAFVIDTVRMSRGYYRRHASTMTWAVVNVCLFDAWWLLECVNYLVFIAAWAGRFATMSSPGDAVSIFDTGSFPTALIYYAEANHVIIGFEFFNAFVTIAKSLYFTSLVSKLNIMPATLSKAAGTMFSVLVLSVVMLWGFALAGYTVYGSQSQSMWFVSDAFKTLILTFFGNNYFEEWFLGEPVFTIIYYALFTIICVQLLFNMITSVLANAYNEAKEERFDPTEYLLTVRNDPTLLVERSAIRFKRAIKKSFFRLRSPSASWKVLSRKLSFYRVMYEATMIAEQGSPREAAVAAAQLLSFIRTSHVLDAMQLGLTDEEKLDRQATHMWHAQGDRSGHAALAVYGRPLPRAMDYARQQFIGSTFDNVRFWCIDMPARSLGEAPVDAIRTVLDFNHEWKTAASAYLVVESDEQEPAEMLFDGVADLEDLVNKALDRIPTALPA
jgi:hypothetical protein